VGQRPLVWAKGKEAIDLFANPANQAEEKVYI
jgi:hypothetical protein